MTTPTGKTPAQVEKEKLQKEWEKTVEDAMNLIVDQIPHLTDNDIETRANIYRQLLALREEVAQCPVSTRKAYNKALDVLFGNMDAIPGSMYLPEKDPKP